MEYFVILFLLPIYLFGLLAQFDKIVKPRTALAHRNNTAKRSVMIYYCDLLSCK